MQLPAANSNVPTAPIAPADPAAPDTHAREWTPLPDLVGQKRTPWNGHPSVASITPRDAADAVMLRYDLDGNGALDPRAEVTALNVGLYWSHADGSHWSGYTNPTHMTTTRMTTSIKDLLAAATKAGGTGPIDAVRLASVFSRFDVDGDGSIRWDEAKGAPKVHESFGDLVRAVGERIVSAERTVDPVGPIGRFPARTR